MNEIFLEQMAKAIDRVIYESKPSINARCGYKDGKIVFYQDSRESEIIWNESVENPKFQVTQKEVTQDKYWKARGSRLE